MQEETAEQKAARLEAVLRAIANSPLSGGAYGDWVQSVAEDALDGMYPECAECGRLVHEGACGNEDEDEDGDE